MSWLFYALLSLSSFSLYDLISRIAGVNAKDPRAYSVVYNALVALGACILFLLEPLNFTSPPLPIILLTILGMLVWTIFGRFEYHAHKHVEASTLAIITRLAPAITFTLSVIFLSEIITLPKVAGLLLITLANLILIKAQQPGRFQLNQGLIYAFIIVLTLGIGWTIDKVTSSHYGAPLFTIMSFLVPAIINSLTPPISLQALVTEVRTTKLILPLLALLTVIGYSTLIKALILGPASQVIPVATATPPFVVILAIIFLREKTHLPQKLIATTLTLLAIYLLR